MFLFPQEERSSNYEFTHSFCTKKNRRTMTTSDENSVAPIWAVQRKVGKKNTKVKILGTAHELQFNSAKCHWES
jgi:hypothetical protein